MVLFPYKGINDIWMRQVDDHYEYIALYVDNLAIASKDTDSVTMKLVDKYFLS